MLDKSGEDHPHAIPGEWLAQASLVDFVPSGESFRCDEPHVLIPVTVFLPIFRSAGVVLDANGFGRDRMLKILHGVARGEAIPPIYVEMADECEQEQKYRLRDGFHRYYAALWLGFAKVPVEVLPRL